MTEADEPMVFSIAALRMVAITHAGQTQSTAVILFLRGQPSRTADKFWTLHKAMFADGDRSIQQTNPEDHCITILQMATTAYSRQTQKTTALPSCRWRQLHTADKPRRPLHYHPADGDNCIQQTNPEGHCITALQMATTTNCEQQEDSTSETVS